MSAPRAIEPAEPSWKELPLPSTASLTRTSVRQLYPGAAPHEAPLPARSPRTRAWLRRLDVSTMLIAMVGVHIHGALGAFPTRFDALLDVPFQFGQLLALLACAYLWSKTYVASGLYADRPMARREETLRLATSCAIGVLTTVIVHQPMRRLALMASWQVLTHAALLWSIVFALAGLARVVAWWLSSVTAVHDVRHVLIVGSGPRAVEHYRSLMNDPRRRSHVVGFVDVRPHAALASVGGSLMGRLHDLEELLARTVVDEVYIALPLQSCYNEFQRTIHVCERVGVRAAYRVDAFQYRMAMPRYEHADGAPMAMLAPIVRDDHLALKRVIDIGVSALAIGILAPVFLAVALAVRLTSPGPVFFAQERYGQHKRRFKMYKFRSMRIDAEAVLRRDTALWDEYRRNHFKLPESRDPRITPIGRFLRKSSLDELPQLWNVLRGNMSLIGPRPIVPAELEHYGVFASLLLALKPGLAGAWAAEGRSTIGYPRRAEIELSYVREWSLLQDAKIFLRTIPAVLLGWGAH